jgi:SAM-dependent methyltransferase
VKARGIGDGDGPIDDDWDSHWGSFGAVARENPANLYRYRLIFDRLGAVGPDDRLLDIGSGQGDFAVLAAARSPEMRVRGIEYSALGVERARKRAEENGVTAGFSQRDLLVDVEVAPDERNWANLAVCSEVLEHVDDPDQLLRHALDYLDAGCRLIITVPGGPRTAFDRHIGHRRHFDVNRLQGLLSNVGLEDIEIARAGFPFFNLYRLAVMARGQALITASMSAPTSTASKPSFQDHVQHWTMKTFEILFRFNLDDARFGWQLIATAVVPS